MYSMKFFLVVSRTYIAEGEKTESLCGKCQNESREASPLSMFPFFVRVSFQGLEFACSQYIVFFLKLSTLLLSSREYTTE